MIFPAVEKLSWSPEISMYLQCIYVHDELKKEK